MPRAVVPVVLVLLVVGFRLIARPPAPTVVHAADAPAGSTPEARGRILYERYGCAMCHGRNGEGDVPNPNAETDGKIPAVRYVAEGYTRAELRRLIAAGQARIGREDPAGPPPPYRMPAFRGLLTDDELGDLVAFLESLYPEAEKRKWR